MSRNLVLCLDGTSNEPETGATNVARIYDLAGKDADQLCYYDPGVGTMGARSATTRTGKALTRTAGLVVGFGIRDNIEEAYTWLMNTYRAGDRVMVFGFSRGAYTALALTGMLRTVGLLRPGAENLVPYALKLYAKNGRRDLSEDEEKAFWAQRAGFADSFGNPDFERFAHNVAFLGLWDTVKSVGWLNAKARFEQAHWPFTRKVSNVAVGQHAMSLDENRGPFAAYRFDPDQVAERDGALEELWFPGVHSDVGGQYADHRLSDLALTWMAGEAAKAGLAVDAARYTELLGVAPGMALPASYAIEGKIHRHPWPWVLAGPGWRPRKPRPGDGFHESVQQRIDGTAGTARPYRPKGI
ncbi:MAG: DUF2235 domain-containing protein [Nocardioidaceae bacterium]|nr:DUF2235 domain-containing protein [Nocardioidaceae bacterium]